MRNIMISTTHKNNSDSPIKNNETGGGRAYLARVGERRAGCRVLLQEPEGRNPLGRLR